MVGRKLPDMAFGGSNIPEPSDVVWTGAVDNKWDVNTTANFSGKPSGTFSDRDHVTFDDTGLNTTITIATGGVAPGSLAFSNTVAKDYVLSGGPIKGATSLVVSGGGQVTLKVPIPTRRDQRRGRHAQTGWRRLDRQQSDHRG